MDTRLYRLMKVKRWQGRLEPGFSRVGRWHSNGRSVIYMAKSPTLALLEWIKGKMSANLLEHEVVHAELVLIEFTCELNDADIATVNQSDLPPQWWLTSNMLSEVSQKLGNAWLDSHETLALRVPSATMPPSLTPSACANVLLNPAHPVFSTLCDNGCLKMHPFNITHYLNFVSGAD